MSDQPANEKTTLEKAKAATPKVKGNQPEKPRWWVITSKILHFVAAIFLFILAIKLMTKGGDLIGPRLKQTFISYNGVTTLSAGWLGAYLVLSGSPMAATAITLFGSGSLTQLQTFTWLSGSRMGASLIVLLVGFIYSVRNKDKKRTIGMGVLALSLTAIVYVPGMLLGYGILKSGLLSGFHFAASEELNSVIDKIWGPLVHLFSDHLPGLVLFPVGLGVILISFKLLDRVLPELDGEQHASHRSHWLKKPWPMFGLGCLAAFLTLSVSVALTILVPLAAKGHVNRREAIPYIMGANITTLADTLVVAMLTGSAAAQIVLAEAIAVSIITIFYLAFFYKRISKNVIALDDWVVKSNTRVTAFVVTLFLTPVVIMGIGIAIGPVR